MWRRLLEPPHHLTTHRKWSSKTHPENLVLFCYSRGAGGCAQGLLGLDLMAVVFCDLQSSSSRRVILWGWIAEASRQRMQERWPDLNPWWPGLLCVHFGLLGSVTNPGKMCRGGGVRTRCTELVGTHTSDSPPRSCLLYHLRQRRQCKWCHGPSEVRREAVVPGQDGSVDKGTWPPNLMT